MCHNKKNWTKNKENPGFFWYFLVEKPPQRCGHCSPLALHLTLKKYVRNPCQMRVETHRKYHGKPQIPSWHFGIQISFKYIIYFLSYIIIYNHIFLIFLKSCFYFSMIHTCIMFFRFVGKCSGSYGHLNCTGSPSSAEPRPATRSWIKVFQCFIVPSPPEPFRLRLPSRSSSRRTFFVGGILGEVSSFKSFFRVSAASSI